MALAGRTARPGPPWDTQLWVASVALVAWSLVANLVVGEDGYLVRNVVLTGLLLAVARQWGLQLDELGLSRERLGDGLRWGLGGVVVVAAAVALAVLIGDYVAPVGWFLDDDRADLPTGEVTYHALLRIPVGTAVFEEVAFRSLLLAVAARWIGTRVGVDPWPAVLRAVVVGSLVFGLWHVGPTIVALEVNDLDPVSWVGIGAIVGAVVTTTVAGVVFCLLRLASGSLLAPVLVHWSTNALGLLAASATG